MTRVDGEIRVPGDKSISHRALMFAALSEGRSRIAGVLESADVHSTAGVLRALGAELPPLSAEMTVQGIGLRGLVSPNGSLDCGNSGTTTRLMAGIVAGADVTGTFVGDASLSRRPMRRVAAPLSRMGATIDLPAHGGLPMTVRGGSLAPIEWKSEVASAQVKSAVLLAAMVAGIESSVEEPSRSRDHTERMLAARGASVTVNGNRVRIAPTRALTACDTIVPGDPSSAAFFAALAALAGSGTLVLPNVCVNPTRVGFLGVLQRMGARVELTDREDRGGEPTATVVVSGGAPLRAITVDDAQLIPTMIDELPLLACLAARVPGETIIRNADELRAKESDRITAVVSNLRAIGVDADELPNGMRIRGSDRPLTGRVHTHGDHRLAMAFGILGAIDGNNIEIDDRDCVSVSYPNFWSDLSRAIA